MNSIYEKFNLPKYTHKAKNFAEASSLIAKKHPGTDPDTQESLKEMMGRLRQAQEYVKQMNAKPESNAAQAAAEDMMKDFSTKEQQQFFLGGLLGKIGPMLKGAKGLKAMDTVGKVAGAAGDVFNAATSETENKVGEGIQAAVDTGVSFIPGVGQAYGIAKAGLGMAGKAIGGDGGAAIESVANPISTMTSVFKNKDATFKDKMLSAIPGVGGIVSKGLKDDVISDAKADALYGETDKRTSNYAYGGLMKSYLTGGLLPEDSLNKINDYASDFLSKNRPKTVGDNLSGDISTGDTSIRGAKMPSPIGKVRSQIDKDAISAGTLQDTSSFDNAFVPGEKGVEDKSFFGRMLDKIQKKKEGGEDDGEDDNKVNLYSQIAGKMGMATDAYQLANLKKPEQERLARMDNRWKGTQVDEKALENIVSEETGAARSAITSAGGGSGSTMSNIRALGLEAIKAKGDAYLKAKGMNDANFNEGQRFNADIGKINLGQDNLEIDINARNEGAYDTQKSELITSLGDNFQASGKEELFKQYPELMGAGYDWTGNYLDKATPEQLEILEKRLAKQKKDKLDKALADAKLKEKTDAEVKNETGK